VRTVNSISTLNSRQNHNQTFNKNSNNNGNRGRYRYPRVLKDLQSESNCDFRCARGLSSATKQQTGSGGRGGVGSLARRCLLPVKVVEADRRSGRFR
jgi:hypothetical protein